MVEQDHRFIKRLVKPGMGFASFNTARNLEGIRGDEHDPGAKFRSQKGDILGQVEYAREFFGVAA